MNRLLIWQLAIRYFRGKRSANAVPILSRISMVAIAVSTAAMMIVFSVYNGLERIIKDNYKAFYSDVRITAAKGKFFQADNTKIDAVKKLPGIQYISMAIEDNVLVTSAAGEQKVVTLKGVDREYLNVNDIREYISGEDSISMGHPYTAIAGKAMLDELGVDPTNIFSNLDMYYLNPAVTNPEADPASAYQTLTIHPAGSFNVGADFDTKYVLAPLPLVQKLFNASGQCSSIEIKSDQGKGELLAGQLKKMFGDLYRVETRYEQNRTLYMILSGEKWAIYAILLLVLLIASFNMVGALSMLVLEKQKDIAILKAMGALPVSIRRIFLLEGVLWSMAGGLTGIAIGVGISLLQQQFGFVKLVGTGFSIDTFPIDIQFRDFLLVLTTILIVGLLAALYPSRRATTAEENGLKST